ncbi:MAG: DedA family protein, partial [Actinomycetota bacterium]
LINPMCGVARIDLRKFVLANAFSSLTWGAGFIAIGFFVGERLAGSFERYLLPTTLLIIFLSTLPVFTELFRAYREKRSRD